MEKQMAGEEKRRVSWVDFPFLFGCFLGLCALFSLVVTIGVGLQQIWQARWPETTATIRECSIEPPVERSRANVIDCRISYVVDGQPFISAVRSMSSTAPENVDWEYPPGRVQRIFDAMQDWVDAHPPGSPLIVHYDPFNHQKAALDSTDMPLGGPQTRNDAGLTAGLSAVTAAFLAVGFFARRLFVRRSTADSPANPRP
jgi:hypothetical protein